MTLSPSLDLPLVRALLLSHFPSLPFSLGIFEFRRFHVTDARRSPEERRADACRTGTVFVLDARARERIEPRNFFGESSGPGRGAKTQETDAPRCRRLSRRSRFVSWR